MADVDPLISIIIPVKNGEPWLDRVLSAIFRQSLITQTEVIVIDSGSTDNSLKIIANYPVRVISIRPEAFNHGATRNVGVSEAKGDFVVMTVQDAIPVNDRWLQTLLSGFDDQKIAGVCGAQIVSHDADKNPIDWYRPISLPVPKKFQFINEAEFESLPPERKKDICSWDNVNAMYRKKMLEEIPFQHVSFAEDALWARDAVRKGYGIAYNPLAQVAHYHNETPEYTLKRSFTVYYHFYKFFNVKPHRANLGVVGLLKIAKTLLRTRGLTNRSKLDWFIYNYRQRKAINKAVTLFFEAIHQGPSTLDEMHMRICNTVPQAPKPYNAT